MAKYKVITKEDHEKYCICGHRNDTVKDGVENCKENVKVFQ